MHMNCIILLNIHVYILYIVIIVLSCIYYIVRILYLYYITVIILFILYYITVLLYFDSSDMQVQNVCAIN